MSDVIIDVGKNKTSRINLGIQGENIVEHVIFDISSWVEEYGEGVAFIYAKRRGDDEPYPVALDMDLTEKTATWDVNLTDTAAKGKGSAQLVYVVDEDNDEDFMDDEVKKTRTYATTVQASLVVASEENPSGYDTWLEVLGGYTVRVEAAKAAAETAKTAAEAAQAAAETAQSAAESAQSAAETAEANAEASETDAETAATNAATSETNAANSATSAAASASSASTSATNAANSATSASGSASTAQTAATNASQSASAASGSATNAANSASAAATSEDNAKASEDDAESAASAAATSEANAAASATAASASASSASQSATSASGSASTASTAATTATTKAGEASTSATNAAESASDASDYADAAAQSASEAAASAASLTVDSELSDTSTNPVQNKVIKAELDDKANVDGYYESLGAGTAGQLASNIYEEDSVPYTFRTSGGSIDIGDRETDMIVGGTVAWNQLLQTLDTFSAESGVTKTYSDGVATITSTIARNGIYTPLNYQTGHKYFFTCDLKAETAYSVVLGATSAAFVNKTITGDNQWHTIAGISNSSTSGNKNAYVCATATYENLQVKNYNVIDLTAMFGSTIADYIYSLEQATAGAGVAWFRKLFPKPYYAYNAGELMSVQAASHEMVGFNQWDEEWEVGGISSVDGSPYADANRIRSKNFTPVLPNTTYYIRIPSGVLGWKIAFYDGDKEFISFVGAGNRDFVTPANCHYLKIAENGTDYGTTYNNDICINLSWDGERNGEYEAYVKHSYPLDDSLTLRGIPKLDASNNLYYDGDTYASDGSVTRKYGIVDLGTLTWTYNSTSGIFSTSGITNDAPIVTPPYDNRARGAICSKYCPDTQFAINTNMTDKTWLRLTGQLYIKDTAYTDSATFKTAMSGVYLVYELATPTTETATAYTNPQIVDDFGTEEYVDYAYSQSLRDVSIPVGHYTQYMANLKAKLEMSPNSPDGAGDYIVRQSNGENEYVSLSSNATIQDIIARLEALEGGE